MRNDGWGLPFWLIRLHGSFSPAVFTPEWRGALADAAVGQIPATHDPSTIDLRHHASSV